MTLSVKLAPCSGFIFKLILLLIFSEGGTKFFTVKYLLISTDPYWRILKENKYVKDWKVKEWKYFDQSVFEL